MQNILRKKNLVARVARFLLGIPLPANRDVIIGGIPIGRAHPCFFVGEIGINHNGSVEIAKKLIDAVVEAGGQAVKFQKRTIPACYSREELEKPVPVDRMMLELAIKRSVLPEKAARRLQESNFTDTRRGDYVWAREFTEPEYRELFAYAKERGLLAFASPWDWESVDFLEKLDPPCHKIASASLTDDALLQKIKATGRPIILSTGMSTMEEIRHAINLLTPNNLVLLHTVSAYPIEDNDANIRFIVKLKKVFPTIPIGYSGHERGFGPSLLAAGYGAHLIERHITLDKNMFGTDQAASLEPHEFGQLINEVHAMRLAFGDGIKRLLPSEISKREHLRRV